MNSSLAFDPKLIVTTETIPGYEITSSLGVAEGYELFVPPAFTVEGHRQTFLEMLRGATLDMMNNASAHRAQAILGVRYLAIAEGGMLVYGTAVRIRRVSGDWNQAEIRGEIRV